MSEQKPSVEIRPNDDGSFDELVVRDAELVHAEMMDDDHMWIGIDTAGEPSTHVRFSVYVDKRKLRVICETEPR